MEAKNVGLGIALHGAELDAVDETDAYRRGGGARIRQSRNGVVVGQRERRQTSRPRGTSDVGRSSRAVRRRRVRVKIDEPGLNGTVIRASGGPGAGRRMRSTHFA
jgi:hypothetical protein